jgi:hypothetical protein
MGAPTSDDDYAAAILGSLPSSYQPLIDTISMAARVSTTKIEPSSLIQWIIEEFEKREDLQRREKGDDTAFAARTTKRRKSTNVVCWNCNRKGHTKAECWEEGGGKEGQRPERRGRQKGKGKGGNESANTASAEKKKSAPEPENYAFPLVEDPPDDTAAAARATSKPRGGTMLDSGASSHLSGQKSEMKNLKADKRGLKGVDRKVFATHQSGEMAVELPNGNTMTPVTLRDTLGYLGHSSAQLR